MWFHWITEEKTVWTEFFQSSFHDEIVPIFISKDNKEEKKMLKKHNFSTKIDSKCFARKTFH